MSRIISTIIDNPMLAIWLMFGALIFGGVSGAAIAWNIQGLRLDALDAECSGFRATVTAYGEAAKTAAEAKIKADRNIKENSDHDYQKTIANLRADVERLRNARSGINYLPPAPSGSRSANLACFDRDDLEQALRRFDAGTSGLIAEGDANTVGLNAAKAWAAGIRAP